MECSFPLSTEVKSQHSIFETLENMSIRCIQAWILLWFSFIYVSGLLLKDAETQLSSEMVTHLNPYSFHNKDFHSCVYVQKLFKSFFFNFFVQG